MTARFARSRIDAHNNGDCDAATCPLCDLEIEEERTHAPESDDDMSTHDVHYLIRSDAHGETWDSDPCDCDAADDHDLGQEVRD